MWFDYPLYYYAAMRSLPFPGPKFLLRHPGEVGVYVPPLAVVLAMAEICRRIARGAIRRAAMSFLEAALIVFGVDGSLFLKGFVRERGTHAAQHRAEPDRVRGRARPVVGAPIRARAVPILLGLFVGAAGLLSAPSYVRTYASSPDRIYAVWLANPRSPATGCFASPCETAFGSGVPVLPEDEGSAARYLQLHTAPDEPILRRERAR